MTTELDRTLERAADSLLGTVAATPPGPAPTRPRTAPLLAATALLVVVAVLSAGFALWSAGDDTRRRVPATAPDVDVEAPVELPRLFPGWLPDGYVRELIDGRPFDEQQAEEDVPPQSMVRYGNDEVDRAELVIEVDAHRGDQQVTALSSGDGPNEPVTVRGQAGVGCRSGCGSEVSLSWAETPSLIIGLRSDSLDFDQLLGIAEGLSVDGPDVVLGEVPDDVTVPLTELSGPPRPAYRLGYARSDQVGSGRGLWVSVTAVEEVTAPTEATAVTVRGRDGWLMTGPGIRLTWLESPGVHVDVSVSEDTELGEEDVMAFAEGLREVSKEEWDALFDLSDQGNESIPVEEYAAHIPADAQASATSDGMGAAAYLAADGRICAFLVDSEGKLPDECGDPGQRVHVLRNRAGQPWLLFGTMPEGAQSVAARVPGYEPMPGSHDVVPGLNPRLYLVAVAGEPQTLDFLTSEGTVVESVPLNLG